MELNNHISLNLIKYSYYPNEDSCKKGGAMVNAYLVKQGVCDDGEKAYCDGNLYVVFRTKTVKIFNVYCF
jgi:hypothetical protein